MWCERGICIWSPTFLYRYIVYLFNIVYIMYNNVYIISSCYHIIWLLELRKHGKFVMLCHIIRFGCITKTNLNIVGKRILILLTIHPSHRELSFIKTKYYGIIGEFLHVMGFINYYILSQQLDNYRIN